jgi:hypothetical protein
MDRVRSEHVRTHGTSLFRICKRTKALGGRGRVGENSYGDIDAPEGCSGSFAESPAENTYGHYDYRLSGYSCAFGRAFFTQGYATPASVRELHISQVAGQSCP